MLLFITSTSFFTLLQKHELSLESIMSFLRFFYCSGTPGVLFARFCLSAVVVYFLWLIVDYDDLINPHFTCADHINHIPQPSFHYGFQIIPVVPTSCCLIEEK